LQELYQKEKLAKEEQCWKYDILTIQIKEHQEHHSRQERMMGKLNEEIAMVATHYERQIQELQNHSQ
jgi:hypothetical protein